MSTTGAIVRRRFTASDGDRLAGDDTVEWSARYGLEVRMALERAWEASGHLCGELLVPVLPVFAASLTDAEGAPLTAPTRADLQQLSPLRRRQDSDRKTVWRARCSSVEQMTVLASLA